MPPLSLATPYLNRHPLNPGDGMTLKPQLSVSREVPSIRWQGADTVSTQPAWLSVDHTYAPDDMILWDSWIEVDPREQDPPRYLLYHLGVPKGCTKAEMDDQAVIRVAESTDLTHWTDRGIAMSPSEAGGWDDLSIWSGHTLWDPDSEAFYLYYTGRNQMDGPRPAMVQRIGVAKSKDGIHFERVSTDKPLLESDGLWYEGAQDPIGATVQAWRDPFVMKDPDSGKYVMFFTAKTKPKWSPVEWLDERNPWRERFSLMKYWPFPEARGCIGWAMADSPEGPFELQPPIVAPGKFLEMEVPQIITRTDPDDGQEKHYLFFSTFPQSYHYRWKKEVGCHRGLHGYVTDSLTDADRYRPLAGDGKVITKPDNLYCVKLLPHPKKDGEYVAFGWILGGSLLAKGEVESEAAFRLSPMLKVHWEGESIRVGPELVELD